MTQPGAANLTPEEFLAWERAQEGKHLYVRGEIFAIAGGSPRHNRLCARTIAGLEAGIDSERCNVFTSDQKIGLPRDQFVYADAVVVCGPLELRPTTTDVITNPTVAVEVLSKSTETYDRGDKQKGYLQLSSVEHFVLVSQAESRVEVYTRQDDGTFRFEVLEGGATAHLERLGVSLAIDELYAGVFSLPGD